MGASILLMTFDDSIFPIWCVYTCYAIFLAVPIFWTAYAFIHKDYETTTKYLLVSMVIAIIIVVKFLL